MHFREVGGESIPAKQLGAPQNISETGTLCHCLELLYGHRLTKLFGERVCTWWLERDNGFKSNLDH